MPFHSRWITLLSALLAAFIAPAASASAATKPAAPAPKPQPAAAKPSPVNAAAEKLESLGDTLAAGIYALDYQNSFNVLDSVYYDPATDQLSLVGHFDPSFQGPGIPYLEHLATLLASPKPEFSLTWTAASEKQVDALFNVKLTPQQSEMITAQWGTLFDKNHNLTKAGYYLLPEFGVSPIQGNRPPGTLGLQVKAMPNAATVLQVSAVEAGSPAESAGLKAGYLIAFLQGEPILTPDEFNRIVRQTGAGNSVSLTFFGGPGPTGAPTVSTVQVTLAADPDANIWLNATRYDVIKALYLSNGDTHAAAVVDVMGIWDRLASNPQYANSVTQMLIDVLGATAAANADRAAIQAGKMTLVNAEYDIMVKLCQGFDSAFHLAGNPVTAAYEKSFKATRNVGNLVPAMNVLESLLVGKIDALLTPIYARSTGLQIPPELVEDQFHIQPVMQPQYLGVPASSLLARAMFAGDYLCKRLINTPQLAQAIPGYQTEFAFEQTHPNFRRATGNYRLWISVDTMDTPQSPDGKILTFRNVKMRFNIREQSTTGQDLPDQPGSYEQLLTSLWDKFEQQYPTLHELKEAAKLAAAAKWILQHNQAAAMPAAGRTPWAGPASVPGLVFIELTPDPKLGMAKTHETIIAEGGVSLTPFPPENVAHPNLNDNPFPQDSSVVDLTGLEPPAGAPADDTPLTVSLFSHAEQDSLASQIFHKKIVVPEPHPAGWFATFHKGNQTFSAVSVALNQLKQSSAPQTQASIELRQKLERVRLVAVQLAQVERALNILNEKSTEQTQEFQKLQAEITKERDEFYEHIWGFAIDRMLDAREELKEHPDIAEAGDIAKKAKEDIDYYEGLQRALATGSLPAGTLEAAAATIEKFSAELAQIAKELGSTPAATYFETVTELAEWKDIIAMTGQVGQLELITNQQVAELTSSATSVTELQNKLLALQKKLTDQLDALCSDPQVKALTTPAKP